MKVRCLVVVCPWLRRRGRAVDIWARLSVCVHALRPSPHSSPQSTAPQPPAIRAASPQPLPSALPSRAVVSHLCDSVLPTLRAGPHDSGDRAPAVDRAQLRQHRRHRQGCAQLCAALCLAASLCLVSLVGPSECLLPARFACPWRLALGAPALLRDIGSSRDSSVLPAPLTPTALLTSCLLAAVSCRSPGGGPCSPRRPGARCSLCSCACEAPAASLRAANPSTLSLPLHAGDPPSPRPALRLHAWPRLSLRSALSGASPLAVVLDALR